MPRSQPALGPDPEPGSVPVAGPEALANIATPDSAPDLAAEPPLRLAAAIAAGIGAGACVALQGRINADLAAAGAGLLPASWYSYLGTWLAVIVAIAVVGRIPATLRHLRRSRWWWYAIGLCGVPIVLAMTLGIPVVGVALAGVCSLAGQTVAGMVLDARGVGIPGTIAFTVRRAAGALCAVGGLAIVLVAAPVPASVTATMTALVAVALFGGGFILAGQQSGNGIVVGITRDPLLATLTSCTGGFAFISVIVLGAWGAGALGSVQWPGIGQWWLYLGGPLGMAITALSAYAVRHLGTLVLTFVVVGGQMATAVIVDLVSGTGASWATAVAIAAIAAAIGLASARRRKV